MPADLAARLDERCRRGGASPIADRRRPSTRARRAARSRISCRCRPAPSPDVRTGPVLTAGAGSRRRRCAGPCRSPRPRVCWPSPVSASTTWPGRLGSSEDRGDSPRPAVRREGRADDRADVRRRLARRPRRATRSCDTGTDYTAELALATAPGRRRPRRRPRRRAEPARASREPAPARADAGRAGAGCAPRTPCWPAWRPSPGARRRSDRGARRSTTPASRAVPPGRAVLRRTGELGLGGRPRVRRAARSRPARQPGKGRLSDTVCPTS